MDRKNKNGFISVAAIIIILVAVASVGTGAVLHRQSNLSIPLTEQGGQLRESQSKQIEESVRDKESEPKDEESLVIEQGHAEVIKTEDKSKEQAEGDLGENAEKMVAGAEAIVAEAEVSKQEKELEEARARDKQEKLQQELEAQRLAEEQRQQELKRQQELEAQRLAEERKRQQEISLRIEMCKASYIIKKEKKTTGLLLELMRARTMWENTVGAEYDACVKSLMEQVQKTTGIGFSDLPGESAGGMMFMIRAQCDNSGKVDELVDHMRKLRLSQIQEELQLEYLQCLSGEKSHLPSGGGGGSGS